MCCQPYLHANFNVDDVQDSIISYVYFKFNIFTFSICFVLQQWCLRLFANLKTPNNFASAFLID